MRNKLLVIAIWALSIIDLLASVASAEPMSAATAMLIGGGLSGGGALLGGLFGRQPAQQYGFDVYEPDVFPGYEQLQGTNISYLQSILDDLRAGRRPKYLEDMAASMKERRQTALDRQYFGTPGERVGALNLAQQAGTAAGIGERPGIANVNKQLYNFNAESAQIDNYINELIGGYQQQTALTAPQLANAQTASNPYQVIPYGGIGGGGGGVGAGIGAAGQAIGGALSNYGLYNSIFGGGGGTTSTTGGTQAPGTLYNRVYGGAPGASIPERTLSIPGLFNS